MTGSLPEPDPSGEADDESGRTRRCIASGETRDPALMVRFVVGPDDAVWPDVRGELPGRGLWVSASRAAITQAVERKAFARAAKQAVTVPAGLADQVERLLARRALDWLGLARGGGQVRAGYEKVREKLEQGRVAVLVQARDGSPAQRQKVAGLARGLPIIELFDGEELSLALGRENVVHAALSAGPLADRFLGESARLAGFRVPVRVLGDVTPLRGEGPVLEIE